MIDDQLCCACGDSHPPSFVFRGTERPWHRPVPTRSVSAVDRFWHFVNKRAADQCWEWTGRRRGQSGTRPGYGVLGVGGARVGAHRFSYELHHDPVTDGLWVLHECDNPPCVNPAHLFLGTPKSNSQDMGAKGRNFTRCGTDNHASKLKPAQVIAIWGSSRKSHELAAEYGVARRIVTEIRLGHLWVTVTGGPSPVPRAKATIPWRLSEATRAEILRLGALDPPLSGEQIARRVGGVTGSTVRRHLRPSVGAAGVRGVPR